MHNNCCVVGCNVGLFVIIQNQGDRMKEMFKKRQDEWIACIKRKDLVPTMNSRVCKAHFIIHHL